MKGTMFIQSSHLASIMIFHILLVIVIAKATQMLLPHHPFLSLTRDSRPLRESYTGSFVCVEYHKFSSHPETPRCIMQKPVNPIT